MKKYTIFILAILLSFLINNIYSQGIGQEVGIMNNYIGPELPSPNPTSNYEIGVRITTDKDTYYLGENIEIYITATNLTSDTFEIPIYMVTIPPYFAMPVNGFPPGFIQPGPEPVQTDYKIDDNSIPHIWAKCNSSLNFLSIEAMNTHTWTNVHSTGNLSLGIHTITGYLFGYGSDITNFSVAVSPGPAWMGFTTISVPYISDITTISIISPSISAAIYIEPDTLNSTSKGKWITCYLELPSGYDINNININSIQITIINDNNIIPPINAALHPTEIGDYDNDGIPDLMVKFDRQEIQKYITEDTESLSITVKGQFNDGLSFQGTDNIRTIPADDQKNVQDKKQLPKLGVFNNKINPNKNENTIIRYYLDKPSHVKITIYNIIGEKIKTIVDRHQGTGIFEEIWQGVNENGNIVSSGLYIVHIKTDQIDETRKMIVIK